MFKMMGVSSAIGVCRMTKTIFHQQAVQALNPEDSTSHSWKSVTGLFRMSSLTKVCLFFNGGDMHIG